MRRDLLGPLILLAGALCQQTSLAAGFELNGRALGDRVDEVLNDPRYECGGASACFLFTSCTLKAAGDERWHGVPIDALTLHYTGERITAMQVQFASEHFQRVAEATAREHGTPASEVPAGVSANLVYRWQEGGQVMRLERVFSTGRASLIIGDQRMLDELLRQQRTTLR